MDRYELRAKQLENAQRARLNESTDIAHFFDAPYEKEELELIETFRRASKTYGVAVSYEDESPPATIVTESGLVITNIDETKRCPTCQGRNRETTDMVCQTCGRDYMMDHPYPTKEY